jgi:hypothetical protein
LQLIPIFLRFHFQLSSTLRLSSPSRRPSPQMARHGVSSTWKLSRVSGPLDA